MKRKKALLVENQTREKLFASLLTILEPHIDLQTLETACDLSDVPLHVVSERIRETEPHVVFISVGHTELLHVRKCLSAVRDSAPVPVVLVIDADASDEMFELAKDACNDFVTSPLKRGEVLARVWRLLGQRGTSTKTSERPAERRGLIGESPSFLEQVEKISQIANWKANVLLTGETGTGKELYARAIHYSSPRAGQPFMPVNCGAIPADLVENELFGHERGAFTSAVSLQTGLIEEANGGTLFLDEIDCLPVLAQVKLLRFLQEKEYRPLGSPRMKQANVRVIAASNANLEEAVGHGKVRQDLFYRLNIISIALPPLRERREDIPLLAQYFLEKYAHECENEITGFSDEALHLLMVYRWPGNVRELENAIERATVLCSGNKIEVGDLLLSNADLDRRRESLQEAKAKEIARFEKNYIQGVLSVCKGNITHAAQVAQKNRRAFWQLIQKHKIDVARFRRAS